MSLWSWLLCVSVLLSLTTPAWGAGETQTRFWITNGTVHTILGKGANLYIGGDFSLVGPNTGRGTRVERTTSSVVDSDPHITGDPGAAVYAAIDHGITDGGWFVGGNFLTVNGKPRTHLVLVTMDGEVDPIFNITANGPVRAFAVSADSSKVYIGGDFTQLTKPLINDDGSIKVDADGNPEVETFTRNRIAALTITNADTAAKQWTVAPDWAPNIDDGAVRTLKLQDDDTVIFVGGSFQSVSIGNTAHDARGITALTTDTGDIPDAWLPAADSSVNTGATVNSINLHEFETATGNGPETRRVLYVGGTFSTIGGAPRERIAALDASSGTATSWNPGADGEVNSIDFLTIRQDESELDMVFAGGAFNTIGGTNQPFLARLAADTDTNNTDTTWQPVLNNLVSAVLATSSLVYVAGEFTSVDATAQDRAYLAAFNTGGTGNDIAASWDADADAPARALAMVNNDTHVFVGGEFITLSGVERNKLASLNTSSGRINSWQADILDGSVRSLGLNDDGSTLFVGGDFTQVDNNGESVIRNRLASYQTAGSGRLNDWNPEVQSGTVTAMALVSQGETVRKLAIEPGDSNIAYASVERKLYKSTDGGNSWNLLPNAPTASVISDILIDPNTPGNVYLATLGSGFYRSTDRGETWTQNNQGLTQFQVMTLAMPRDSSYLLLGTILGAANEEGFFPGGVFKSTDQGNSWRMLTESDAFVLAVDPTDPNLVYMGTSFGVYKSTQAGEPVDGQRFSFTATNNDDLREQLVTDIAIAEALDVNSPSIVYAATGNFVNMTTDEGDSWTLQTERLAPGAINDISVDILDPATLYVAIQGQAVFRGQFQTTGSGDNVEESVRWAPASNGINNRATQTVIVDPNAGSNLLAGSTRGQVFKSTDTAQNWVESDQGIPHDILYIGGSFTGSHPDYIAALETTLVDPDFFIDWNANSTGPVNAMILTQDKELLYSAGSFTSIGGQTRQGVAALDPLSASATDWSPSVDDGAVHALAFGFDEQSLFIGGTFTSVNTEARARVAQLDTQTNAVTAWNPGVDDSVNSLAVSNEGNLVYIAGEFTTVAGQPRSYLASILTSSDTDNVTDWTPNPDTPITGLDTLAVTSNTAFVGGSFRRIAGITSPSLAVFGFTPPVVSASPKSQAFRNSQSITLTCVDSEARNCATIFYTTDPDFDTANWVTYTGPVELSTTTQLTFYGVDDAGIRSLSAQETYIFDFTIPNVNTPLVDGTYGFTQTAELICDDGNSEEDNSVSDCADIFFTTDGSTPTFEEILDPEGGPRSFVRTGSTSLYELRVPIVIDTQLRFVAVDQAGNASATETRSYRIKRDTGGSLSPWALVFLAVLAYHARRRASRAY